MLKLMNEQLEFVRLITGRLDSAKIPYMMTGSVAMAVYAKPRMTRDLDLVVECRSDEAETIIGLLEPDCYLDAQTVRRAIETRSMFNVIHQQWIIKADFIIRKDEPYRQIEFERRRALEVEGVPVWVVAPEDLILSKLAWAKSSESSQQRHDVRMMLNSVADLDWGYLEKWAVSLGVDTSLADLK